MQQVTFLPFAPAPVVPDNMVEPLATYYAGAALEKFRIFFYRNAFTKSSRYLVQALYTVSQPETVWLSENYSEALQFLKLIAAQHGVPYQIDSK